MHFRNARHLISLAVAALRWTCKHSANPQYGAQPTIKHTSGKPVQAHITGHPHNLLNATQSKPVYGNPVIPVYGRCMTDMTQNHCPDISMLGLVYCEPQP